MSKDTRSAMNLNWFNLTPPPTSDLFHPSPRPPNTQQTTPHPNHHPPNPPHYRPIISSVTFIQPTIATLFLSLHLFPRPIFNALLYTILHLIPLSISSSTLFPSIWYMLHLTCFSTPQCLQPYPKSLSPTASSFWLSCSSFILSYGVISPFQGNILFFFLPLIPVEERYNFSLT